ncbi:glycoside hydrolase/deacetylase [Gigaspora margarita]|uniref:Glycoside hydrolase/deacetylase n=1 Tax=Gigaspora margarita TaxID=4874 RepID=A0A8H4B3D6_GIGMA|nr:glycoside hydrolase/deacetylase [Gigaspora margarita]
MQIKLIFQFLIVFIHQLLLSPMTLTQDSGSGFITNCSKPGIVVLTFDDGSGQYTNSLLQLKKLKLHFFVLGTSVEQYPEILNKIFKERHQIGVHTYTHPHLNDLTYEQQKEEIVKANDAIYKIIGVIPNYMRPPFGECDDECGKLMKSLDLIITQWTIDFYDWHYQAASYQEGRTKTLNNILGYLSLSNPKIDSFILLQHYFYKYSVDIVPEIVEAFEKKGYTFETVAECLVESYKNKNEDGKMTKK